MRKCRKLFSEDLDLIWATLDAVRAERECELMEVAGESIDVLIRQIGMEDDAKLTPKAQELKREVIRQCREFVKGLPPESES